jgi:hypothetical protein
MVGIGMAIVGDSNTITVGTTTGIAIGANTTIVTGIVTDGAVKKSNPNTG